MKVMARFSPECAVVLLEHLDTPVTRFLLSHPPLSQLFEPQVRPRGCQDARSALGGGADVVPSPKQASCRARGSCPALGAC